MIPGNCEPDAGLPVRGFCGLFEPSGLTDPGEPVDVETRVPGSGMIRTPGPRPAAWADLFESSDVVAGVEVTGLGVGSAGGVVLGCSSGVAAGGADGADGAGMTAGSGLAGSAVAGSAVEAFGVVAGRAGGDGTEGGGVGVGVDNVSLELGPATELFVESELMPGVVKGAAPGSTAGAGVGNRSPSVPGGGAIGPSGLPGGQTFGTSMYPLRYNSASEGLVVVVPGPQLGTWYGSIASTNWGVTMINSSTSLT